jgi:hypothetical protein
MWGEPRVISLPQPAVATVAKRKCPPAVVWYLQSVSFILTVDTTAGTRTPYVTVDNAAGDYVAACVGGYAATAAGSGTQATQYTFAVGLAEWDAAGTNYASGPLATLWIAENQEVAVRVDNIQAADQLSKVTLQVLQYPVSGAPRAGEPFLSATPELV